MLRVYSSIIKKKQAVLKTRQYRLLTVLVYHPALILRYYKCFLVMHNITINFGGIRLVLVKL